MVTPSRRDRSIRMRQKSSRATGSTPEVGSSRISISGSWIIATASDRRWRMPERQRVGQRVHAPSARSKRSRHLVDARRRSSAARHVEQPGVQLQVLPHRQLGVEREGLRHVADAAAGLDVVRRRPAGRTAAPGPRWPAAGRSASSSSSSCRSRWSRGSRRSRRARCGSSTWSTAAKSPKRMVRSSRLDRDLAVARRRRAAGSRPRWWPPRASPPAAGR